MELEEVIKTYSDMASIQLLGLVNDLGQLRKDCIPHLKEELIKRGELEGVERIDAFVKGDIKIVPKKEESEIKQEIKSLIDKNESIDSIKEVLKDEGVNFSTLNKTISDNREKADNRTNEILKFIVERSNLGDSIQKTDSKLIEKFNLTTLEVKNYREKLTKMANKRIRKGVILLIISLVIAVFYSLFAYGYYKKGDFSFYFITVLLILIYLFTKSGILLLQGRLFLRSNK